MPRPKRSKIAPSAPTALPKALLTSIQPIPAQPTPLIKQIVHPDSASHSSSWRGTVLSDDSEGFVKTLRKDKCRHDLLNRTDAPTMSGALAQSDIGATRLRPVSGKQRAELARVVREADRARAIQAAMSPGNREKEMRREEVEVQVPSSQGMETVVEKLRSTKEGSVEVTMSVESGLQGSRPGELTSAVKAYPALPFKKRPRQPSLLQLTELRNDVSPSRDLSDLDDFNPDDESTPFILRSKSQVPDSSTSSPQHLSVSRKRKITPPEIQVPRSRSVSQKLPNKATLQGPDMQEQVQPSTPLASPFPAPSSPEPVLPTRHTTTAQPNDLSNSLLAPPLSSSPPRPSLAAQTHSKPNQNSKPARTRKFPSSTIRPSPGPAPLSDISTTSSPAKATRTTAPKALTTASLQNLLPRRRRKPVAGAFDIPDSSDIDIDTTALGEHEDELSYHAPRKSTVRKASATKGKKAVGARGGGRTYARRRVVERENVDGDGEEDVDVGGAKERGKHAGVEETKRKDEFERLRKKFAEVDEWKLEIEDVTQGSSSHGMGDAR